MKNKYEKFDIVKKTLKNFGFLQKTYFTKIILL